MKKIFPIVLLVFAGIINSCTDIDDNLEIASTADVITKDSQMYNLIERVVSEEDNPLEDIVCIDFVYPLQVKVYNAELIRTDAIIMSSDEQFSAFLGNLTPQQALSISYPIITTFTNGETFTINNNDELKVVIDQCSREDIVTYYSSVFCNVTGSGEITSCVWNVQYLAGYNNKYVGGTFLINPDNTLVFNYDGADYQGNWIFLFVNDELHLNINLEGTSQVASDWNIDRKIIFTGSTIEIIGDMNTMLVKTCQETEEYEIGDVGPGGGIVFYDKGEYAHGWRYMEAATQDLQVFEWGCMETVVGSLNPEIGYGLINTAKITNHHDALSNYYTNPSLCSDLGNGSVSAQKAILLDVDGVVDWFLPSADELSSMYVNLQSSGLGNFTQGLYWSSTETNVQTAKTVNFSNGETTDKVKNSTEIKTRAIRYF